MCWLGITSKTSDDAYVLDFLQLTIHVQIFVAGFNQLNVKLPTQTMHS